MRRAEAGLALALAAMAFLQSGCVLSGKPKTAATPPAPQVPVTDVQPAPPPEPLSVPQTQVQLPQPQPIPDTIALPPPRPEEPATPPAASRGRKPGSSTATQAKPETTGPPATPPNTATPTEPERPPVQDILPAEDLKRYQDSATRSRTETRQLLTQVRGRRLDPEQNRTVQRIQSFLSQSEDAEKRGDMRQADAFAERGLVLARVLTGVK